MPNNIDFIGKDGVQGNVASQIANKGLDAQLMRPWIGDDGKTYATMYSGKGSPNDMKNYRKVPLNTNGTLRRDEWKQLDEAVMKISESRLGGVQDLISSGLTFNLGNAMGTTVLEYHDLSDAMKADLTMDGVSRSKGDRPVYSTKYLPVPIIHVDYEINARVLAASRSMGNPLDTTSAERAARKVNEKLEQMLFTDTDYSFGGGKISSYVNFDNRNQVTLSNYGNWDDSGTSPRQILECVKAMKQASIDAYHYGPWTLYIPTNYETELDDDFEDSGNTARGLTIRERLLKIEGINKIQVVDTLGDDNVLLVQMTPDVVRLVRGMGITNVQWETEGRFITKYKVMTIQVPQIRSDQDGNCGIIHAA
jgi:uncharacterized linocin/CFP29 family protein